MLFDKIEKKKENQYFRTAAEEKAQHISVLAAQSVVRLAISHHLEGVRKASFRSSSTIAECLADKLDEASNNAPE